MWQISVDNEIMSRVDLTNILQPLSLWLSFQSWDINYLSFTQHNFIIRSLISQPSSSIENSTKESIRNYTYVFHIYILNDMLLFCTGHTTCRLVNVVCLPIKLQVAFLNVKDVLSFQVKSYKGKMKFCLWFQKTMYPYIFTEHVYVAKTTCHLYSQHKLLIVFYVTLSSAYKIDLCWFLVS